MTNEDVVFSTFDKHRTQRDSEHELNLPTKKNFKVNF